MERIEHVVESSLPKELIKEPKKYCILVSGLVRGFYDHLFEYLKLLPDNLFDIFLNFSDNDSKFMNSQYFSKCTKGFSQNFKQFMFDIPKIDVKYSNREANSFYQYFRLQTMIDRISDFDKYSLVIRIRPDIKVNIESSTFLTILHTIENKTRIMTKTESNTESNTIYIPKGYDIFDHKILELYNLDIKQCVNDQFAICTPDIFKIYCSTYNNLFSSGLPIVSEHILFDTLVNKNKVSIERIDLDYSLVLSKCNTIAISGDSASGKSHLLKLLSEIFPYDQRILLETDRYHKYDRYDKEWNSITHLHPNANNLEKMADDLYCLKLGDDVFSVDYDHCTGRFTEPELIHSKPFLLLCGLHTMYSDKIRDLTDLKIFMDTPKELKTYWKILRDVSERNHSIEHVLSSIKKRDPDFQTFILPQKEFANLIIRFDPIVDLPSHTPKKLNDSDLSLTITLDYELYEVVIDPLRSYIQSIMFDRKILSDSSIIKEIAILKFEVPNKYSDDSDYSEYYDTLLKKLFTHILYTGSNE
jgi:uridine kinase